MGGDLRGTSGPTSSAAGLSQTGPGGLGGLVLGFRVILSCSTGLAQDRFEALGEFEIPDRLQGVDEDDQLQAVEYQLESGISP